jgi:hypothetical protein
MRRWVPWALGLGGLGLLWASRDSFSFGGASVRAGVDRDPSKLVPAFARRIERVFSRMRARGFQPFLWEGYRTPARAAELERRGTGISDSLHAYGIAVDVVDGKQWDAGKDPWSAAPGFWAALGEEAEREGLTWGGRFSKVDHTHIQGVPVSQQSAARAATPVERAAMVA